MKVRKRTRENEDNLRKSKRCHMLERKGKKAVPQENVKSKRSVKKARVASSTAAVNAKRGNRVVALSPGTSSVSTPRTRSTRSRPSETTTSEGATQSRFSAPHLRSDGEITLDKTIINRYRQRIDEIRHATRKSDKNEVFYGRCAARRNLFEDDAGEDGEGGICTRNSECIQMNRSGRSIQTTCKVYMAHVLLNVHNDNPLSPCKPPKNSSFRLHRLVRPASKTDKKRLSRLKQRIARERSGLPSSIAKNRAPSEVSSVVDCTDAHESCVKLETSESASGEDFSKVTVEQENSEAKVDKSILQGEAASLDANTDQ